MAEDHRAHDAVHVQVRCDSNRLTVREGASTVLTTFVTVAMLVIGLLAGFLTFKRSQLWCQIHGPALQCPTFAGPVGRRAEERA